MSILENTVESNVPTVKPKNSFVENLEKLDLQGVLLMLTILSERALYLQSKEIMDKKSLVKPKSIIHA